jgi:hypothetical protein
MPVFESSRLLHLVLVIHVAVSDARRPHEIVDAVLALQVQREPLEPIRDFAEHRLALESADFLEISELRDFHAIEPHFPSEPPRAERRRLPVVLDETDIVLLEIDAQRFERAQVQALDVGRRGLEYDLILVIVLQAIGIFAVAAVFRPARGLHVSGMPGLGAYRTQERRGVERTGTDLHVVRLQQRAAEAVPVLVEVQYDLLKGEHDAPACKPRILQRFTLAVTQPDG